MACAACGGDDGGGGTTPKDAAATLDSPALPVDSKVIDAPPVTVVDAPAGTAALTVKNYVSWCEVSVDGRSPSTADVQVVNVMPGAITLTATAATGFILGRDMWHHTDGDTGRGEAGSVLNGVSTAMVTVGASAKCVWVCCPFPDGSGCDPDLLGDQCP